MILTDETITFGKYKNSKLSEILKDRSYCKWLLKQKWFVDQYEYLYNRIIEYNPLEYFVNYKEKNGDFCNDYPYFNLFSIEELKIKLSDNELNCYKYYIWMIDNLKLQIENRKTEKLENIYDIKAPVKWLKNFENTTNLDRKDFKNFINSYDLPNIPYIIEDIKKIGGIDYKGARSFTIAKKNSENQEKYWEDILKEKYGENIGTQFKFENCIFDFIHIKNNTIYECKLGIKDFNEEQYKKYLLTLSKYKIVYLIDRDCVIDIEDKTIYTDNNKDKYVFRRYNTNFDEILINFDIIEVENIKEYI